MTKLKDYQLNQHIQQALSNKEAQRITVVLEEVFGDNNDNYIEVQRHFLESMEYSEGMLVMYYQEWLPTADGGHKTTSTVQMICKKRIKRIYFDNNERDSRLPFPKTQP